MRKRGRPSGQVATTEFGYVISFVLILLGIHYKFVSCIKFRTLRDITSSTIFSLFRYFFRFRYLFEKIFEKEIYSLSSSIFYALSF
jgi:hypothetical protein